MIPVSFVHESFPAGCLRVDIPAVPNREDVVCLNNEDFVVISVAHSIENYYVAFVYLLTVGEYQRQNRMKSR